MWNQNKKVRRITSVCEYGEADYVTLILEDEEGKGGDIDYEEEAPMDDDDDDDDQEVIVGVGPPRWHINDMTSDLNGSPTVALDSSLSVKICNPKLFDCCICFQPLSVPVFQCYNGHMICSTCRAHHHGKKCPICSSTVAYYRCRAIELVLESIKISCMNAKYGCKETLSYAKKNDHEETCIYIPCFCPFSGCDFVASSKELSLHFINKHGASMRPFIYNQSFDFMLKSEDEAIILQEQNDGKLFILKNNNIEPLGNAVNISFMGPNNKSCNHHYEIVARSLGSSVQLHSLARTIQRVTVGTPSSGFILIPRDYFDSNGGSLSLEIKIRSDSLIHILQRLHSEG